MWLTSLWRSPSAASLQRSGSTRSLSPRRPREEVKELIPCDWNSLFTLVGDLGILQSQACDASVVQKDLWLSCFTKFRTLLCWSQSSCTLRTWYGNQSKDAQSPKHWSWILWCLNCVSIAVRVSVAVLSECFYHRGGSCLRCSRFCASCEMSRRSHLEAVFLSFYLSIYRHYLRVIGVVSKHGRSNSSSKDPLRLVQPRNKARAAAAIKQSVSTDLKIGESVSGETFLWKFGRK